MDDIAQSLRAELPLEGQLIAACISTPSTSESRARAIALAARDLDWERVASEAAGHHVIPPVHRFLAAECADRVPADIAARLRAGYVANALAHLRLARDLLAVHDALCSVGLGMLALKGPALAIQAYGDLAARQSGDLDILIRPGDLPRIGRILAERGYRSRRHQSSAPDFGFFRCFEDQFEKQGGVMIDLHLALVPIYFPFRPNHETVWRNAVAVELAGHRMQTLAPDDHLIFSIAHATKHGWAWASLRAMCDIAALTATGLVDWERGEWEMERLRCSRMLRLGALLAYAFAGAQVPAGVLARAVSDPHAMRLAREIASRFFPAPGLVPSVYSDWVVPVSAIEGWGKRARYLIDRGLRPTIEDWEALPLPRALYWMYYLTRPARLLLLHGPRFVQRGMEPAN
jgi:hypothetical protein